MNNNIIQLVLGDKEYKNCHLIENEKRIRLFNEKDYDTDILIKKLGIEEIAVYDRCRNDETLQLKTKSEDEACLFTAIDYKIYHDDILDRDLMRQIEADIEAGQQEKVLNIFEERFGTSIFSIGKECDSKISLVSTENMFDVKYLGHMVFFEHLSSLTKGYCILYKYCERLRYIKSFWTEMQDKIEYRIDPQKIYKWYIFGTDMI